MQQPEPFHSVPFDIRFAKWDHEAADVEETHAALAVYAPGAKPSKLASVAGCHPEDARGFLANVVSLTAVMRARIKAWAVAEAAGG